MSSKVANPAAIFLPFETDAKASSSMKRSTQLAELKTHVKHNAPLHKVTAPGALGRKKVMNRSKQSLLTTWVKTTHAFHCQANPDTADKHTIIVQHVQVYLPSTLNPLSVFKTQSIGLGGTTF